MQLWFYKAEFGDYQDKFISWWTRGKYSHVELYFETINICFSSSNRDKGTRFKSINLNIRWDVIDLNRIQDEEPIINFCLDNIDIPYDWFGIVGLGLNFNYINDSKKYYCSEIISVILNKFNIKPIKKFISPNELYKEMYVVQ